VERHQAAANKGESPVPPLPSTTTSTSGTTFGTGTEQKASVGAHPSDRAWVGHDGDYYPSGSAGQGQQEDVTGTARRQSKQHLSLL
jgi:hypothetical protein